MLLGYIDFIYAKKSWLFESRFPPFMGHWVSKTPLSALDQNQFLEVILQNKVKIYNRKSQTITVEPHFSGIFGHREFFHSCKEFR